MATLKIRQTSFYPGALTAELDGHEIRHLTALTLEFDRRDVTVATLRIYVDEVDVDAETLVHLEAHVKARDEVGT
jgi:hypothetical protein